MTPESPLKRYVTEAEDVAEPSEPIAWLPTQTIDWLQNYDGPAVATKTAAHRKPIKTNGGVPVYLSAASGDHKVEGFSEAAWDQMRTQIVSLREGLRRKMNDAGGRAEMAAAAGDMTEVSINSTESERHREAFVTLNVAIGIIDTTDPVLAARRVRPSPVDEDARDGVLLTPRPLEDYHEDMGNVLWWHYPVREAPWVGTSNDQDFNPAWHEWWTPLPDPTGAVIEAAITSIQSQRKG